MRTEDYNPNRNPNLALNEEGKLEALFDEQKRLWRLTGLPDQELLKKASEVVESLKIKGENVNLEILSRTFKIHPDFIFVAANRKGYKFLGHPNDRLYKERNIMVLTEKGKYEMRIENLKDTIMSLKRKLFECEENKNANTKTTRRNRGPKASQGKS